MAIAAIPNYVPKAALAGASPGLRFGMYLQLWGEDSRTRVPNWETADVGYHVSGPQKTERSFRDENKNSALKRALALGVGDLAVMKALLQRQGAAAKTFEGNGDSLILETQSVSPFTSGLGNQHPLENGFAFLNPYGLPYLPGSGVKGVLRQAAHELRGGPEGWTEDAIKALFGGDQDDDQQRGALGFWDVIPQIAGNTLTVEVMTPHQSHYYQKGATPHESGQPNPIHFITVPPGSGFVFHVQCDARFLSAELAAGGRWRSLLEAAFAHAFDWLGFGAKTAVGYGAMEVDKEAGRQREQDAEKARQDAEAACLREAQAAAEQQRLSAMPPLQRSIEEQLKKKPDKTLADHVWLIQVMDSGVWSGADKIGVAQAIQALMVTSKAWKAASNKPDRDKDHQRTLKVQKWLDGQ